MNLKNYFLERIIHNKNFYFEKYQYTELRVLNEIGRNYLLGPGKDIWIEKWRRISNQIINDDTCLPLNFLFTLWCFSL
jgi:hypothetical protein